MIRIILLSLFLNSITYSQTTIPLENLTEEELKEVVGGFSANFHHSPVSSAASLGKIFGFELGLVGGYTEVPMINNLVQIADPGNEEIDSIPHAALLLRASVPLGFTGELTMIPSIDVGDFKLNSRSIGIAWDSSIVLNWPVTLGFKYAFSDTEFDFTTEDPGTGAPIAAEFSSSVSGLYVFLSKSFLVIEPYIGLGAIQGDGRLASSVSLFGYTTATSASEKKSSSHFILGANLNLLFVHLGLEYGKLFDASKYTAKVSFGF